MPDIVANNDTRARLPRSGRRILVVDDERFIRDVFLKVISMELPNCRIDLAVNGAEGVDFFRNARPSVIVMDMKMPVMDGEEAFDEICKICDAENWELPAVIFCTGYLPSSRIQALVDENPLHCLLMKPIKNSQLVDALAARLPRE